MPGEGTHCSRSRQLQRRSRHAEIQPASPGDLAPAAHILGVQRSDRWKRSIQGTVLDTSKAALPGATVTATNVATGIATTRQTTGSGVYSLTPLQPGLYRVTVALDGFQTFVREGIIVDGLAVVGLNVTMQVGGLTQEVVVTTAALPLATADARLGQTIRNDVYTALPLVMNTGGPRDPTAFMSLMPGVQQIGRWGNVMGGQDFTTDMYWKASRSPMRSFRGKGAICLSEFRSKPSSSSRSKRAARP